MKVKFFYIEDLALEAAIDIAPKQIRNILSENAWRKLGFICDDGAAFLTMITPSGLQKIIISSSSDNITQSEAEDRFFSYLKYKFMEAHLVDDNLIF